MVKGIDWDDALANEFGHLEGLTEAEAIKAMKRESRNGAARRGETVCDKHALTTCSQCGRDGRRR